MVRIAPAPPRSTIVDDAEGMRITIPVRRNWFLIVFVAFWLGCWAWVMVGIPLGLLGMAPAFAVDQGQLGAVVFVVVWFVLWTLGGFFALLAWLWNLVGKEVVILTGSVLVIRRQIFGVGRSREYDAGQVRGLRCSPQVYEPWNFSWGSSAAFWGLGGVLAFDYGARTYRFGPGLDEAEAKMILGAIKQRFPELDVQRKD